MRRALPLVVAGAFAGAWFVFIHGTTRPLDPTDIGWQLHDDPAQHLFGWLYFRRDAGFGWPLGSFTGYLHPIGGVVALTDSIPWLALSFKLLAPILPEPFQYFGPWLALCYVLQSVTGTLIARRFTTDPCLQGLAGMLLVLAPPLIWRFDHESLNAHWLVLGMIALHLRPPTRGALGVALGLLVASAGIHPYLTVMLW